MLASLLILPNNYNKMQENVGTLVFVINVYECFNVFLDQ